MNKIYKICMIRGGKGLIFTIASRRER